MSRWLILLMILLLSSCALMRPSTPPLLAPSILQQQMQLNQTLVSQLDDNSYQMLVMIKVTDENLLMLGLSPEGQRLFTLNYDGKALQQQNLPGIEDKLDAERMLRMFQLAYWPLNALQFAYGSDYQIIEQANQRRLMHNDRKIITIDYSHKVRWQESVTITHHQQPLQLKITTTDFVNL